MVNHSGVQGAVPGGVHTPETRVESRLRNQQMKSRRMSLVEAIINVVVGYVIALLTHIIVFPLFALQVSLGENLAIGGLFTLASIARSYTLRRAFEAVRVSRAQPAAAGR